MCDIREYPNGTFLLKVPFDDTDTSVFFFERERTLWMIDCATTAEDVEKYILPFIKDRNLDNGRDIKLLLSHHHGDHAGGASALHRSLPALEIYAAMPSRFPSLPVNPMQNGILLDGFLEVLHLGGHSADACAFFDRQSQTLYTADTVQLAGVSHYGTGVTDSPSRYIDAHLALWRTGASHLVAAHAYFPLGREARGRDAVREYLASSLLIFRSLLSDVMAHLDKSAARIASLLTEKRKREREAHPPVPAFTVERILREGAEPLLVKCDDALRQLQ